VRLPAFLRPPPPLPPPGVGEGVDTRELLRRVRRIELRTRRLVDTVFGGEYHSVFRGQGIEFAEVRPYHPGDDVRTIDWNVTARTGTPHVKKHVEERELSVLLAVDMSASEAFGTRERFKAERAAEVAAVLALSAVRNNDRVGLVLFTDSVEHVVPPRKGRRHALRLIRDLLAFRPAGRGTDMAGGLDYAARLLAHRGVLFLVSDFVTEHPGGSATLAAWERSLRIASRRHDVVAVRITDPAENVLPDVGLLALRDPESGRETVVDSSNAAVRNAYAAALAEDGAVRRQLFRRLAVDEIDIATDGPLARPLLAFFRRRERQRIR